MPRGERAPGPADHARGPGRADGLGARGRPGRRGRGLADLRLADARAHDGHRGVAADGGRGARRHGVQLGDRVRPQHLPHAARHAGDRRLRPPRAADALLRVPAARRRPRPRRDPRPPRAGAAADEAGGPARRRPARRSGPRPRRTRAPAAGRRSRRSGASLLAVRADGETGYPHEQAATDAAALEAALAALEGDDRKAAAKQLAKVGENALAPHLSAEAYALRAARERRQHDDDSWAGAQPPDRLAGPVGRARLAARRARRARTPAPGSRARCAAPGALARRAGPQGGRDGARTRADTRPDPGRSS